MLHNPHDPEDPDYWMLKHLHDLLMSCLDKARPTIEDVRPIVYEYKRQLHAAGGSLHIVLEDDNVSDQDVEYCRRFAQEQGDREGELLAQILLRMSEEEREALGDLSGYP